MQPRVETVEKPPDYANSHEKVLCFQYLFFQASTFSTVSLGSPPLRRSDPPLLRKMVLLNLLFLKVFSFSLINVIPLIQERPYFSAHPFNFPQNRKRGRVRCRVLILIQASSAARCSGKVAVL